MIIMTPGLVRLIEDAEAAGFEVTHRATALLIFKRDGRSGEHKLGIAIFDSRTAHRTDVRQDLAMTIRTQRGMREALGLASTAWNERRGNGLEK